MLGSCARSGRPRWICHTARIARKRPLCLSWQQAKGALGTSQLVTASTSKTNSAVSVHQVKAIEQHPSFQEFHGLLETLRERKVAMERGQSRLRGHSMHPAMGPAEGSNALRYKKEAREWDSARNVNGSAASFMLNGSHIAALDLSNAEEQASESSLDSSEMEPLSLSQRIAVELAPQRERETQESKGGKVEVEVGAVEGEGGNPSVQELLLSQESQFLSLTSALRSRDTRHHLVDELATAWKNKSLPVEQRQLLLEKRSMHEAADRYKETVRNVVKMRRGAQLTGVQRMVVDWYPPLVDEIKKELESAVRREHSSKEALIRNALLRPIRDGLLSVEALAVITVNEVVNLVLNAKDGLRFIAAVEGIAKAVRAEIDSNFVKNSDKKRYFRMLRRRELRSVELTMKEIEKEEEALHAGEMIEERRETWDAEMRAYIGSLLLSALMNTSTVRVGPTTEPAFTTMRRSVFKHRKKKYTGFIVAHPRLSGLFQEEQTPSRVVGAARAFPMLLEPRPWKRDGTGGYLEQRVPIMRTKGSRIQLNALKRAGSAVDEVYKGLDCLGKVKWQVNADVWRVAQRVWDEGGGIAEIPQRHDYPIPEEPADLEGDEERLKAFRREARLIKKMNQDLTSLRADTSYKLNVARELVDEESFYFPCNLDFRGRVYPVPPHLNHLGNDLCRGTLVFAEKKRIGESGFRWFKVHLANLAGEDKCSFEERVKFIDDHMHEVRDSAERPLEGNRWWLKADAPWQCLAMCKELIKAIDSGDPHNYESGMPVHQDGSCNGLQHYAALGKDELGAFHVNLMASDKPQDVYMGVAERVIDKVAQDAASTPAQEDSKAWKDKRAAELVNGHITRKVIKQTVMTSVYGVTFIGAKRQIHARLVERLVDDSAVLTQEQEAELEMAAQYVTRITFESLGTLFASARAIMDWLADCAWKVAKDGQPMSWITPMGLPVVQPYRRPNSFQIRTFMQSVVVAQHSDMLPVNVTRQKSAFPPNYVHSLDSTHMLMTAIDCDAANITFASVHDSYWTHASDVERMNAILREKFIQLHSKPLLENLRLSLTARYPEIEFDPVPERGTLDINSVRESKYFFN